MNNNQKYIIRLVYVAMNIGLLTAASQVSIPFFPIALTLQTLIVAVIAILFTWQVTSLSLFLYLFFGLIGLPFFVNFHSGVATLFGPTGGYLFGFLLVGWAISLLVNKETNTYTIFFVVVIGLIVNLFIGMLWLFFSTKISILNALISGAFVFIPGEIIKAAISSLFAKNIFRNSAQKKLI